ncbi:MAG: hypothetical protein J0H39_10815 [Alphaproteobacteria bacterium]|nr:hypothetical protein [Alphaproteobacteria bacterium]
MTSHKHDSDSKDTEISPKRTEVQKALVSGLAFLQKQKEEGKKVRERWMVDAKELLTGHWLAVSAIAILVDSKSGVPGKSSDVLEQRISLASSFVQGIDLCETSISEGFYVQATALLKQEMETLAALRECQDGSRKNKRTPNVKHLGSEFAKIYGDLNSVAHVADQTYLGNIISLQLKSDTRAGSVVPIYNKELTFQLYCLHIYFVIQIALEIDTTMTKLYCEPTRDDAKDMLARSIKILVEKKWLAAL